MSEPLKQFYDNVVGTGKVNLTYDQFSTTAPDQLYKQLTTAGISPVQIGDFTQFESVYKQLTEGKIPQIPEPSNATKLSNGQYIKPSAMVSPQAGKTTPVATQKSAKSTSQVNPQETKPVKGSHTEIQVNPYGQVTETEVRAKKPEQPTTTPFKFFTSDAVYIIDPVKRKAYTQDGQPAPDAITNTALGEGNMEGKSTKEIVNWNDKTYLEEQIRDKSKQVRTLRAEGKSKTNPIGAPTYASQMEVQTNANEIAPVEEELTRLQRQYARLEATDQYQLVHDKYYSEFEQTPEYQTLQARYSALYNGADNESDKERYSENFQELASAEFKKQYGEQVDTEQAKNMLNLIKSKDFLKDDFVTNSTDYILAQGQNSLIGQITGRLTGILKTDKQVEEYYNPTMLESAAGGAFSVIADSPLFMIGGSVGASLATKTVMGFEKMAVGRMVAGGVSRELAQVSVRTGIKGTLKAANTLGSSMGALGFHGAARDVYDQSVSPEDYDFAQTLKTFGKDVALGAGIGWIGLGSPVLENWAAKAITNRFAAKTVTKAVLPLTALSVENSVFVYGGAIMNGDPKKSWGQRLDEVTAKEWGEGFAMLGILKAKGAMTKGVRNILPVKTEFTREEVDAMLNMDVESAMKDPQVPMTAKVKMMAEKGVAMEVDIAGATAKVVQGDKISVDLVSKDGELLQRQYYATAEQANEAALTVQTLTTLKGALGGFNELSTVEKAKISSELSPEELQSVNDVLKGKEAATESDLVAVAKLEEKVTAIQEAKQEKIDKANEQVEKATEKVETAEEKVNQLKEEKKEAVKEAEDKGKEREKYNDKIEQAEDKLEKEQDKAVQAKEEFDGVSDGVIDGVKPTSAQASVQANTPVTPKQETLPEPEQPVQKKQELDETNELTDITAKYGWKSKKQDGSLVLSNRNGKEVVRVKQTGSKYTIESISDGSKLMAGNKDVAGAVEKVLRDYYYAKEEPVEAPAKVSSTPSGIKDGKAEEIIPDKVLPEKETLPNVQPKAPSIDNEQTKEVNTVGNEAKKVDAQLLANSLKDAFVKSEIDIKSTIDYAKKLEDEYFGLKKISPEGFASKSQAEQEIIRDQFYDWVEKYYPHFKFNRPVSETQQKDSTTETKDFEAKQGLKSEQHKSNAKSVNAGINISEDAQTLIDIIADHPKAANVEKYKKILKDEHGIDFDDIYKDEAHIENANLNDIKTKKDFLSWDNYVVYANKINRLRGFIDETVEDNILSDTLTSNEVKAFAKKHGFKSVIKEYTGEGNYAEVLLDEMRTTDIVDIDTFIHELGHIIQNKLGYQGRASEISRASSVYFNGRTNEVFAENFKNFFRRPAKLKALLPEVYDELSKIIPKQIISDVNKLISDKTSTTEIKEQSLPKAYDNIADLQEAFGNNKITKAEYEKQIEEIRKSDFKKSFYDKTLDVLESLKVDTKGQLYDASLGIPIVAWNASIDIIKTSIKAGKVVSDAITDAIDYLKRQNITFDEAKYRTFYTEPFEKKEKELRDNVAKTLPAQWAAIEKEQFGTPTPNEAKILANRKGGIIGAINKVLGLPQVAQEKIFAQQFDKLGDKAAKVAAKALASKNYTARNSAAILRSVINDLTKTVDERKVTESFKGTLERAVSDANQINKLLHQYLGKDKESYSRINQALDPDFYRERSRQEFEAELLEAEGQDYIDKLGAAKLDAMYDEFRTAMDYDNRQPITYDDLTIEEKVVYEQVRAINDFSHDTRFAAGQLSAEVYIQNKGKYVARLYDTFEMPDDVAKDMKSVGMKMEYNSMVHRTPVSAWKAEHLVEDPIYASTKRLMQAQITKGVSDYAKFVAATPEAVSKIERQGYTLMSGKGYGKLNGKYVRNDYAEDFKGFFFSHKVMEGLYDIFKWYDRSSPRQFYKSLLTRWNPAVRVGNQTGNVIFSSWLGINPLRYAKDYHLFAAKETKRYGEYYRYLMGKGLLNSDFSKQDLVQSVKDLDDINNIISQSNNPLQLITKGKDWVNNSYSRVDDHAKIAAFKSLIDLGFTPDQAVNRIANGFQNFKRVGKAYDLYAKTPLLGNAFGKFQGDLLRMLRTGIVSRPLNFAVFVGALGGMAALASKFSGESEEDKEIRESRTGFAKIPFTNTPLAFRIGKTELNVARFISPYYIYTTADEDDIYQSLLRILPYGIDPINKTSNPSGKAAVFMARNTKDPLLAPIVDVLANSDFRGMPILDPSETKWQDGILPEKDRVINAARFLARSYMPYGSYGDDMIRAMSGEDDFYGREKTVGQVALRFLGYNSQMWDDSKTNRIITGRIVSPANQFASNGQKLKNIRKQFEEGEISKEEYVRLGQTWIVKNAELLSQIEKEIGKYPNKIQKLPAVEIIQKDIPATEIMNRLSAFDKKYKDAYEITDHQQKWDRMVQVYGEPPKLTEQELVEQLNAMPVNELTEEAEKKIMWIRYFRSGRMPYDEFKNNVDDIKSLDVIEKRKAFGLKTE